MPENTVPENTVPESAAAESAVTATAVTATDMPQTIRAARIHAFGGPEALVVEEIDAPVPGPGEVLVRVACAGLNPLDFKLRDGSSAKAAQLDLPAVLGREMSGTVVGAGPGTDLEALGLPVGTRVFGMRAVDDWRGTYAQAVAIDPATLAPVPEGGDLAVHAGLALAGTTALTALEDARLAPGETVLIHGGTGGVGQMLIQLAVAAGAHRVWATGSEANAERIAELGATPIPHDTGDWQEALREQTGGRGVDVIVDTHYFGTFLPSLDHLAEGGRIVVLPTLADVSPATERGIEAHVPALSPSRAVLERLADDHARGLLDVEIAEVLPLAEVARGHELLETGHTRGKIVLEP
ncbi:quinone oxidoreductase family protein [Brachybacterium huguangmaarense]